MRSIAETLCWSILVLGACTGRAEVAPDPVEQAGARIQTGSSAAPSPRARLSAQLTPAQREWLAAHPELRLGIDPEWEPIEYVDSRGDYRGISAAFIERIAESIGVSVRYDGSLSWEQVMERARRGEIDLLPAVNPSPERAEFLNFTQPYLQFPLMVFARKDSPLITGPDDLAGKRVAVERGYVSEEHLRRDYPRIELKPVDTTEQALLALAVDEVDAYVGNLALASDLIDRLGLGNLKVAAPTPYTNELSIGVRKDAPELLAILDQALAAIPPDERRAIRQQVLAIRYDMRVDRTLVWRVLAGAVVLVCLVLAGMALLHRQKCALARSRRQMELALEGGDLGSWDWDLRRDRVVVNERWAEIVGHRLKDIEDPFDLWRRSLHPEDRERFRGMIKKIRMGRVAHYSTRYRVNTADGRCRWVLVKGAVVEQDKDGKPRRMVGTVMDVTEQVEANLELSRARAEADKASSFKSRFLANMSHEIRTPMNAIVGFAHLAAQTDLDPRQRGYVEKISASAHALLQVINDILDFSKIEAGKLAIEQTPFSLDDILDNLVNLTALRAEQKGLELLIQRDPRVPGSLLGDPLRISQVLINLVGNAVKFTEHGEVTIKIALHTRRDTGPDDRPDNPISVDFSVVDTGIGIPEEAIPRLLTAFSQVDGSTTRRYGGSGLGLSICKHLVELMGGELRVESRLNEGSRFSFTLPLSAPAEAQPALPAPDPELAGTRTLVVDDSDAARQILTGLLSSFGFEVATTDNAEAAIRLIREADQRAHRPFKLVLMDWRMPGMDGITAGRRIREDTSLSATPIIILVTAYGREQVMAEAQAAGLDGCLIKPLGQAVLYETIVRAMGGGAEGSARPGEPAPAAGRLRGRVLVVEDNVINRQVAGELLQQIGLDVEFAEDGATAIARLTERPTGADAPNPGLPDLVLMDVQMPDMDGYEVTRRLRRQPGLEDLPVIALTAHAMAGERERCLEAGMNDHLPKPIDPELLHRTLGHWLPAAAADPEPSELRTTPDTAGAPPSAEPPTGVDPGPPEDLPGIDTARGLARVGGNRALYRRLLMDFRAHHAGSRDALAAAVSSGDQDKARRLTHTISGVAGNLGAGALQTAAAEIEERVRNGRLPADMPLPEEFVMAFDQVMDAIATLDEDTASAKGPAHPVASGGLQDAMDRLRVLLEDGDPEAKALMHEFEQELVSDEADDILRQLAREIDGYDFDLARETLERLHASIAGDRND